MCTDIRELTKRFQRFAAEHGAFLTKRNETGWPAGDFERYRRLEIELDGMARLLDLSPAERAALEKDGST